MFFLVFVSYKKSIPNEDQMERNFLRIFLVPKDNREALGGGQRSHKRATSSQGVPQGGAPPSLRAPRDSPNPNLSSINTQIFPVTRGHTKNTFPPPQASILVRSHLGAFSGTLFTTRENPSSSAGLMPISSAGNRATSKALQLKVSSSVC